MKNKKLLAISALTTVLLGSTIFFLEKQQANHVPKTKVYVAKGTVDKGKSISNSNFKLEERPSSFVTKDIATEKDKDFDITKENKVAKETIYEGEMLNKKRMLDKGDPASTALQLKKGEVEFPINVQLLDNYAGTYRPGDFVKLAFTPRQSNEESNPKAEILIDKIRVLGAIDSSGKFLKPEDKNVLAVGIAFAGTEEDLRKIAEKQDTGKFKMAKINSDN